MEHGLNGWHGSARIKNRKSVNILGMNAPSKIGSRGLYSRVGTADRQRLKRLLEVGDLRT